MKIAKQILSLLFTASLLIGCSAEDGQDGAIGPQGPQGLQGEQGNQGEQGETGTANVIYSDWIASKFGSLSAAEHSEQLLVSLGLGDFNRAKDVLLVYGKHEINALSDDIFQLPFELFSQNEVYRYRLTNGTTFTALYADAHSSDGGNKLFTYFDDYRYVIIPGGVSKTAKSSADATAVDYTKMSYEEITAYFNIPY